MKNSPEITIEPVIEWFTQSLLDVSETMFSLGASPSNHAEGGASNEETTLVACIGTRGDCRLEVAIYLPHTLASRIASISLEMPAAELDEKMVDDVAGEFSNMVVGAVKSRLSDLEVPCTMTVPRVVRVAPAAPDARQRVQAALAVIRGSAGPRDPSSATPSRLVFALGGVLLHADLYL
jgi:CheY-specific phosphatase CheX